MHFDNHFSRADLRAFLALLFIVAAITGIMGWLALHRKADTAQILQDTTGEVNRFWKEKNKHERSNSSYVIRPFPFDPNTASATTLTRLGLPPRVVLHLIHYRQAGGRFKTAKDFAKIYGLSEADFRTLLPYISIAQPAISGSSDSTLRRNRETPQQWPGTTAKFTSTVQLDLNRTDSATLMRIPGIGNYYAHRILRYGQLLGGYTHTQQLDEIKGLPPGITKWFCIYCCPIKLF